MGLAQRGLVVLLGSGPLLAGDSSDSRAWEVGGTSKAAAAGLVVQIFPVVFAAFYWPRATGTGALSGLLAGIAVSLFFRQMPELAPIAGLHEGLYGLVVNVPVLVIVSLLTQPQSPSRVRSYVEA